MDAQDSHSDARFTEAGVFDVLVTGDELLEWCERQKRDELHIMLLDVAPKNERNCQWRVRGKYGPVPKGRLPEVKRITLTPPKKLPGTLPPGSIFTGVRGRFLKT